MAAFGSSQPKTTQDGDLAVQSPPMDSVSCLAFNGSQQVQSSALLASAWDNTVSCYALQQGGMAPATPAGQIKHNAPVLCCDFAGELDALSGSCDGELRSWNIQQGPGSAAPKGRHNASIRCLKWNQTHNVAITGGWDKMVKVWDLRSPTAAMELQVTERVYAMDTKENYIVVGTADKGIHVIDMRSRQLTFQYKSPLSYQTRCISIFHDGAGYAVGCIEGRVAIEYYAELPKKNTPQRASIGGQQANSPNFVFKCHRDKQDIYAVNAIHFHPHNTFLTAGSDGVLSTWDKDNRSRLANFDKWNKQIPITDAKFSPNGALMAYALSYDWSKGQGDAAMYQGKNGIFIHRLQDSEYRKKK